MLEFNSMFVMCFIILYIIVIVIEVVKILKEGIEDVGLMCFF